MKSMLNKFLFADKRHLPDIVPKKAGLRRTLLTHKSRDCINVDSMEDGWEFPGGKGSDRRCGLASGGSHHSGCGKERDVRTDRKRVCRHRDEFGSAQQPVA